MQNRYFPLLWLNHACAICTLLFAMSFADAATQDESAKDIQRSTRELDIREALFRYQVVDLAATNAGTTPRWCLSLTTGSAMSHSERSRVDPPLELMQRFDDGSGSYLPVSACQISAGGTSVVATGESAAALISGSVTWVSETSITIEASYHKHGHNAGGGTYVMELIEGMWRVTGMTGPVWQA